MKNFLPLFAVLALCACSSVMSTEGAYVIDSSAYTVLTVEEGVLSRPCTATVTSVCVSKALAQTLSDSRIILMAALHNYQTVRASYNASVASGGTADTAAVTAAYNSLQDAISSANSILALDTVKAIIASINL